MIGNFMLVIIILTVLILKMVYLRYGTEYVSEKLFLNLAVL